MQLARYILAGICAASVQVVGGPAIAQDTVPVIDESRVIIPRAKIIRLDDPAVEPNEAQAAGSTIETSTLAPIGDVEPKDPLADLTEGAVGTGAVFSLSEEQLALQSDPTTAVALPETTDDANTPKIRVLTPEGTGDRDGTSTESPVREDAEPTEETEDQDGKPRWLRERTRRFKVAPKGEETLNTDRSFAIPIASVDTEIKTGARLRQLDKMTGQTVTFELLAGETRQIDRLVVHLDACRSPESNASHGVMAFLNVRDTRNIDGEPDFTGWMFAESPALSALDHPRYDLWVISCTISAGAVSAVNE